MKKTIFKTALLSTLMVSAANADFTRVEMGAGAWQQTPSGYATRTDNDGVLKLDGTYTSAEKEDTGAYAWIFIKHPLPIIPNIRLEYVSFSDEGTTTGKVNGIVLPTVGAPTTVDIQEYDVIPYYNILDNTFWTTIDIGVDIKTIQSDSTVGAVNIAGIQVYKGDSSSDTTIVPLVYLRGRVEIPATNIGIESDVKAITDGTNTMYDVRAKIDYTFDFIPVVQPALEVGYRIQKLRVDDGSSAQVDLKYAGPYMGIMARF